MSKRNSQLRGIVVAADTQEQALDHFRAVASGNYQTFESKDGEYAFASSNVVGTQIMNPLNGEELVPVPEEERHEMVATASAGSDMDVVYKVCASGCGSHVIADSEELLLQCPSCASALPPMEDAELKTNQQVHEILLAVATTRKDAAKAYRALASGSCKTYTADCDGVMVISNQPLAYDIYQGTAAKMVDDYVPQLAVASSAEGEKLQAHYLTTAAVSGDGVQQHVISSEESPVFCPISNGCLIDPADALSEQERAVASADFDDEDEEESEEDEDESEEDEDDEEEEDEDDEEDDEDDESEDDDDDEDDLSLSLATAKPSEKAKSRKGGAIRKEKKAKEVTTASSIPNDQTAAATAEQTAAAPAAAVVAEAPQTPAETVPLVASMVAYASADMKDSSLDVRYVGELQGDKTWIAFHDGIPFAKATASNAENPAVFADESFGRAFKSLASEQGPAAAIAQMRFEEIRPQLNVEKLIASQVEAQVQEQVAEIATASARDQAELGERFMAALATAAQGINRGFFPDLKNPVRIAIASTLEELGVQNGDELLARAFGDHSDSYNQQLLAKASDIMQYDLTVQNQLANAINDVKEVNVATASSVSIGSPVKQPLNTAKQVEVATAASAPSDFKAKLSNLRFN